ncbi:hypothetical protein [Bradyrhizobium sp. 2S1]|uniref:hypothetical protein n=1 Tax=Bradyrhizobium sp. 2S1 TaxID=1404429 RepID=UPI00140D160D|nr:hypothetical protein [Bradyrhizobium sp. 2S1]MCK7667835.1 hypothetical protein [Bradyrhizobium sp. 2S1]
MTRAVFAAGGPAPEVLGEVTLDGRLGIVLPRFDGPTLTQATRTGAITREQAGAILATLCLAVHKTRPPPHALSLREAMVGIKPAFVELREDAALLGACLDSRCSNLVGSDSTLGDEQVFSALEHRSDAASAAECAGLRAERPCLAVYG